MQFDVHLNVDPDNDRIAYFIELQNEYAALTRLRIVAPLLIYDVAGAMPRLHPTFSIDGRRVKLAVSELFSIDTRALGPVVANLASEHDRIIAALDFLFTGV